MSVEILTKDDFLQLKTELLREIQQLIAERPQQKKWLKSDEVKRLLKVSPGTLQTLRINGTLQYTKIGGIIYYDCDHIQKTLQQNLKLANHTS